MAVDAIEQEKAAPAVTQTVASSSRHNHDALPSIEIEINEQVESDLNVTEEDLLEAREAAKKITLDDIIPAMREMLTLHENDPNFPLSIIDRIKSFLGNESVFQNPERHVVLIEEMKLETALITINSPYAEVRAVVDNHDDGTMLCGTIRAWVIGMGFACILAFVNQLFSVRQPAITLQANVAQLLAYPIGKLCERFLPDRGFTLWGVRHSLNPGPFTKKEHMLITVMANVSWNYSYSNNIIWVQYLDMYFGLEWAGQFGYQILLALATNFIGYGVAGLIQRFLVYPSYCIWPASLVTIALNNAFHTDRNTPVQSPLGKIFTVSRLRFFGLAFVAMFVYFWFPNYIMVALSVFSWITWIAPNNLNLSTVCGFNNGLGINPWPTWDWNIMLFDATDPLMIPFFSTFNKFIGACLSALVVAGVWYSNSYNTGYLPINSNRIYDNTGELYDLSRTTDEQGMLNLEEYENYSFPFLSAGNLVVYLFFFAIYSATITYAFLYHRHEIAMGFKNIYFALRRKRGLAKPYYRDVHDRLMSKYAKVPEWWYMLVLLVAVAFGCTAIAAWDTHTTPGVVFYGLALCIGFIIPIGIIKAMTGLEVTLNVLTEFIGGSWVEGNALAMMFFKSFGYVTCAHAIWFSSDLKLAHYAKIPPRQTFCAQIVGTLISSFVCVGVLNFQMKDIDGICTVDAPNRFTCPNVNTFFSASVLWGTIGPRRVFGPDGMYTWLLAGFPLGFVVPIVFYYVNKKWTIGWLRQIHPVAMFYGALMWAPYNMAYIWPAVPIAWYSWVYLKRYYLGFWSKYNFVLSAAFSSAIAVSAIIIFFCLQWWEIEINWWGNNVVAQGCENNPCMLKTVDKEAGEYFGPRIGTFH